jgi:LysR family transcriptional regulator for metE and metH
MYHLEIKHLKMVRAIAETGNMTRAAEKLFLSQSALSQQLKDIEGKLKVGIFYRTRKKMILTAIGKTLFETARQVVGTLEDTEMEIARIASGETGELKVGTQCVYCYKWLPHVMNRFQKKFPNIEVVIGNAFDAVEDLTSKKSDVVITGMVLDDDNTASLPLFEDELVCIMAPDSPACANPFIRLEDFSGLSLISPYEKNRYKFYLMALKPLGIEPKKFMAVAQAQAIIEMVASGFGVSLFPRWAIRDLLESNTIAARPITKNGVMITWRAAFLKSNKIPLFQEEFVQMVANMNIAKL